MHGCSEKGSLTVGFQLILSTYHVDNTSDCAERNFIKMDFQGLTFSSDSSFLLFLEIDE